MLHLIGQLLIYICCMYVHASYKTLPIITKKLASKVVLFFRSLYWYWRHHCWSTDISRNSESYQESKGGCDRGDPKSTQHGTWTNTWQHSKADFWESGKVEYRERVSCLEFKIKLCICVYLCVNFINTGFQFQKIMYRDEAENLRNKLIWIWNVSL